ncbi:YqjK-like family protein [Propionivibrio sp.]|uniref:YqjK-like family protein n=1 Tax=Propionivibrio sp. TaxID=2212460 RepID=UPI00262B8FDF|nr:YqjK-like family protein [Propionivibrio sp.]
MLERIDTQRAALGQELRPVRSALDTVDRLLARVLAGVDYLKTHPSIAALAIVALLIMKPRRAYRWSTRAFSAWQIWRILRDKLAMSGL